MNVWKITFGKKNKDVKWRNASCYNLNQLRTWKDIFMVYVCAVSSQEKIKQDQKTKVLAGYPMSATMNVDTCHGDKPR